MPGAPGETSFFAVQGNGLSEGSTTIDQDGRILALKPRSAHDAPLTSSASTSALN
jgi:hypothetical protein